MSPGCPHIPQSPPRAHPTQLQAAIPALPGLPRAAASLCAQWDTARTRTIYMWLEQIPRWLHSFPCILFSLPGPRGHFPFPPACPLPARLISLSWPCSPTPHHSHPRVAPSRCPRAPPVLPLLPLFPALTAWSSLCSSHRAFARLQHECRKRRTAEKTISEKPGRVCSSA